MPQTAAGMGGRFSAQDVAAPKGVFVVVLYGAQEGAAPRYESRDVRA
jgi:hypothetical protein